MALLGMFRWNAEQLLDVVIVAYNQLWCLANNFLWHVRRSEKASRLSF